MIRNSPESNGIFVLGSTGTLYSAREIGAEIQNDYSGSGLVGSELFSSDPPKGSVLMNFLHEISGTQAHIYAHSSGGAQLGRALTQASSKSLDMSAWTVIAIDVPRRGTLREGMKVINGPVSKAVDSVTVYHPANDIGHLDTMREGLRQVFPQSTQSGSNLMQVASTFWDYSSSLSEEKTGLLRDIDGRIIEALSNPQDLDTARTQFIKRGKLLYPEVISIYNGNNRLLRQPDLRYDEVEHRWKPRSAIASTRLLPGVVSGQGWQLMVDLHKREDGLRVVTVIPEYSAFNTTEDAIRLYGNQYNEGDVIFLSDLTHAGIALQPRSISGIKEIVDQTAA